jgi:holo-[acyl-carrier protein] synthase
LPFLDGDKEYVMLAVGIDLIEIERIERGIARHGDRFTNRFFTPQELSSCERRVASLAGKFAVKEAVGKAFGTGIGDVSWQEIEVLNDERGRPFITLTGAAKLLSDTMGLTHWAISISHTDTHAVGMAVALSQQNFADS